MKSDSVKLSTSKGLHFFFCFVFFVFFFFFFTIECFISYNRHLLSIYCVPGAKDRNQFYFFHIWNS